MLIFAFFLALFAFFIQGIFIPKISILAFAPFLAFSILLSNFPKALILAFVAGAFVDVFSSDPFGIHALNFSLVTFFFHRYKKHFLHEKPLHLSLMTALISMLSTLLGLTLLFLFDRRVPFSGRWVFTDLLGMPFIDALYAFVWFSAPITLFQTLKKLVVVFWLKRKNRSLISH